MHTYTNSLHVIIVLVNKAPYITDIKERRIRRSMETVRWRHMLPWRLPEVVRPSQTRWSIKYGQLRLDRWRSQPLLVKECELYTW